MYSFPVQNVLAVSPIQEVIHLVCDLVTLGEIVEEACQEQHFAGRPASEGPARLPEEDE